MFRVTKVPFSISPSIYSLRYPAKYFGETSVLLVLVLTSTLSLVASPPLAFSLFQYADSVQPSQDMGTIKAPDRARHRWPKTQVASGTVSGGINPISSPPPTASDATCVWGPLWRARSGIRLHAGSSIDDSALLPVYDCRFPAHVTERKWAFPTFRRPPVY